MGGNMVAFIIFELRKLNTMSLLLSFANKSMALPNSLLISFDISGSLATENPLDFF